MLLRNSLSTLHVIVVAVCSFRAGVEAFSHQERGVSVCRHQHANLVARRRNLEPVSSQNGRPFIVSYRRVPTGRYGSSGNDNDENGWFFRPPVSDSLPSKSQASDQENTSRKNSTLATLAKEKAPNEKEGVSKTTNVKIQKPTAWKTKTALSPLAELEDPPPDFLDLQNPQTIFGIAALAGVTAVVGISYSLGLSVEDFVQGAQTLVTDPQTFSQQLIEGVQGLGPTGVIYYALIYMIAEILAIPATPLTLSAGYLFGVQQGILTVLAGATGAACIGFWISRTFLREYVESTLLAPSPSKDGERSPNTLAKLDKAIGEEGFKLLVLIRLSPIFPFSVTNYLYGASSMAFAPYLLGTLIGFVPTTTAYVYTGMVGQALTTGQGGDQPWYVYAGGFTVLAVLVKLVTDVATGIIEAIDDET
mmetsp:Transcript_102172/g.286371  ORF Transcript_102172/g.286371 Transcript_102172/m.286371 type:complete len:419 (+) Transcript_102172:69-1325(+)